MKKANTLKSISIRVGYPWTTSENGKHIGIEKDFRWSYIGTEIRDVCKKLEGSVDKIVSPLTCRIDLRRIRATHGRSLFGDVHRSIREADILIMDIGSSRGECFNTNVVLEAGMGLALHRSENIFILKPKKLPKPSDLEGRVLTEYEIDAEKGRMSILDLRAFKSALRSRIMAVARTRADGTINTPDRL